MPGGLEHTQKETARKLDYLLENGKFPYCSLFHGPSYTGRMYAAMEVAKRLGSTAEGTLVLSSRNFSTRIRAAGELFKKNRNPSAAELLERNSSAFLMQFHGAIEDSQSGANLKKFSDAGECMDMLSQIHEVPEDKIPQWTDRFLSAVEKLYPAPNSQAVTVGKVRAIKTWCQEYSADGKNKTVIIEGLEDSGEAVSNALLKILEEPPVDTYFILIASNPGRVGQTILSRVRQFRFEMLGRPQTDFILNSLFVNPSEYDDLESFFILYSGIDDRLLRSSASTLLDGKEPDMRALVKELEATRSWDRFFSLVLKELRNRYLSGDISERRCSYLSREIENVVSRGASFNQNKRMTLDFVVFRTMEVLR